MLPEFDVREVRSLAQCWAELVKQPEQFVILEATSHNLRQSRPTSRPPSGRGSGESLLERIRAISTRWPTQTAMAVVMQQDLAPTTWLLREAGAIYVATCALDLPPLKRIARRHFLRTQPATSPSTDDGLLASKHLNLPW